MVENTLGDTSLSSMASTSTVKSSARLKNKTAKKLRQKK